MDKLSRLFENTLVGDLDEGRRFLEEIQRQKARDFLEAHSESLAKLDDAFVRAVASTWIGLGATPKVAVAGVPKPLRSSTGGCVFAAPLSATRVLIAPIEVPLLWDDRLVRLFSCDCVEHVLPIYRTLFPGNDALDRVIRAGRVFAEGGVERAQLQEMRSETEGLAMGFDEGEGVGYVVWSALQCINWTFDYETPTGAPDFAATAVKGDRNPFYPKGSEALEARELDWQAQRLLEYLLGVRGQ